MELIDSYNEKTEDVDYHVEYLITSDMQLQYLERDMKGNGLGAWDGTEVWNEVEAAEAGWSWYIWISHIYDYLFI